MLSAHVVTTLHYLNARTVGSRVASETTDALLSVFDVAPVDAAVLKGAALTGWKDFEDAVTSSAADRSKCDVIVTQLALVCNCAYPRHVLTVESVIP